MLKELRNIFLAGLLVLTPLVVTLYVFYQLFVKVDGLLGGKLVELTGRRIPGMGFVTVILLILLAGVLARNYIGKKMIQLGENILNRIPFFNRVYTAVQQLSQAFFSTKQAVLRKPVLIEFPKKGSYCIGFQTSETKGEIQRQIKKKVLSVFLPTTPNPTSGYLLFIPKEKVYPLQMSVEEAIKLVISGGAVLPQERVEFGEEGIRILGDGTDKTIEN